ncbi:MAG: precorrin-6y C5,15-methyltransferase (decarboxylating) subunit CbiE [Caloramator sp.]|nr:MAG: precorrin-6y C5,15-methyltransferase (decarboxylating) subunit CbiE [Caloramator sp.]
MIVVGIGPGNLKYASLEAIEKIKNSNKVLAFKRVAKDIEEICNPIIINELEELIKHKDACFVASGDPCLYGVLDFLIKNNIEIEEVVPSISSIQYMFSKIKRSWSNANIISLHGRDFKDIGSGIYAIFTDRTNTPNFISKRLSDMNKRGRMFVGYNLSYSNERILEGNIGDCFEELSDLSVVICYVD